MLDDQSTGTTTSSHAHAAELPGGTALPGSTTLPGRPGPAGEPGQAEIAALADRVATARGKLPLQTDPALFAELSEAEIAAERELAEWIRAQRRRQRRRSVTAELAGERREGRVALALRRADEADARWHRRALAARRRVSSPDARLAQLYRRAEWSSRALIGVVVLGMVWAGVNVQHNLVPSGDMADPLYWLSYGFEAMISIPIITIMVVATTAARWGREIARGKVVFLEAALLGTTIALNAGPHLAAHAPARAAEAAVAPVMVGVVIWLHAWTSARYAHLIDAIPVDHRDTHPTRPVQIFRADATAPDAGRPSTERPSLAAAHAIAHAIPAPGEAAHNTSAPGAGRPAQPDPPGSAHRPFTPGHEERTHPCSSGMTPVPRHIPERTNGSAIHNGHDHPLSNTGEPNTGDTPPVHGSTTRESNGHPMPTELSLIHLVPIAPPADHPVPAEPATSPRVPTEPADIGYPMPADPGNTGPSTSAAGANSGHRATGHPNDHPIDPTPPDDERRVRAQHTGEPARPGHEPGQPAAHPVDEAQPVVAATPLNSPGPHPGSRSSADSEDHARGRDDRRTDADAVDRDDLRELFAVAHTDGPRRASEANPADGREVRGTPAIKSTPRASGDDATPAGTGQSRKSRTREAVDRAQLTLDHAAADLRSGSRGHALPQTGPERPSADDPQPSLDIAAEIDDVEVWAVAKEISARGLSKLPVEQLAEVLTLADESWTPAAIGASIGLPGSRVLGILEAARRIRRPYAISG
jgi:hypothetical protein